MKYVYYNPLQSPREKCGEPETKYVCICVGGEARVYPISLSGIYENKEDRI